MGDRAEGGNLIKFLRYTHPPGFRKISCLGTGKTCADVNSDSDHERVHKHFINESAQSVRDRILRYAEYASLSCEMIIYIFEGNKSVLANRVINTFN